MSRAATSQPKNDPPTAIHVAGVLGGLSGLSLVLSVFVGQDAAQHAGFCLAASGLLILGAIACLLVAIWQELRRQNRAPQ
jgi:hypothetical protein